MQIFLDTKGLFLTFWNNFSKMPQQTGNFVATSTDTTSNYTLGCQSKDRQGNYQPT